MEFIIKGARGSLGYAGNNLKALWTDEELAAFDQAIRGIDTVLNLIEVNRAKSHPSRSPHGK